MNRRNNLEEQFVAAIKQGLELSGYLVMRVGQYRADLGGSDPGVPDLIVIAPWRQEPLGLLMEVKVPAGPLTGKGGKPSKRQKELADMGVTVIVTDPEEAIKAARWWLGGKEDRE